MRFSSLLNNPRNGRDSARWPLAVELGSQLPESAARGPLQPGQELARRRLEAISEDSQAGPASPAAPLDPWLLHLALLPPVTLAVEAPAPLAPPSQGLPLREELQHLITGLVRRVAWGGDRRRGSARLELSEGPLAGATLTVHAEQRSVSVELELPAGISLPGEWQRRILARLAERGFSARVRIS